jgi:hypothetical protein
MRESMPTIVLHLVRVSEYPTRRRAGESAIKDSQPLKGAARPIKGRDIYDACTFGGKKNRSGGCIEGSGLFELMSSQPDIVNEILLLQHFTEPVSTLIRSPKCHP